MKLELLRVMRESSGAYLADELRLDDVNCPCNPELRRLQWMAVPNHRQKASFSSLGI